MAVQKKFALGRGLDALISTEEVKTSGSSSINEIELSKISVNPTSEDAFCFAIEYKFIWCYYANSHH